MMWLMAVKKVQDTVEAIRYALDEYLRHLLDWKE